MLKTMVFFTLSLATWLSFGLALSAAVLFVWPGVLVYGTISLFFGSFVRAMIKDAKDEDAEKG